MDWLATEVSLGYNPNMVYRHPGLTNATAADTLPSMARAEVIEYTDHFGGLGSTSIEHVWYNQNTGRMTVRFKQGGLYSYDDVTWDQYLNFAYSDSLGTHFRSVFRRPGNPWPGAKHNDRTTTFNLVGVEEAKDEVPDLDSLKPDLITLGSGKTFRIAFDYTGHAEMNVRGKDWQAAVTTLKEYMSGHGFDVTVTGVHIDALFHDL